MPANINIDPNIALGIKQQDSMTGLSQMLNMANAAQQYRQAQQMNPLQLQQKQMEIEQLQKTNPLAVRQSEELVKQAETATAKSAFELAAQKAKAIHDTQISLINNPLVLKAEKDPSKLTDEDKGKLFELIEKSGKNQAKALGMDEAKALELMQPTLDIAKNNPGELRQLFKERHIQTLDAASRTGALAASGVGVNTGAGGAVVQTGEFGPVKPGEIVKGTSYVQQVGPGSREQIVNDAEGKPVVVVTNADGVITGVRKLTNAPTAPQPTTTQPTTTQPNQQPQTKTPQTRISPNMGELLFPIRQKGDTAIDFTPQEKLAREQGDAYVSKLTNSTLDLSGQRRTLEDTIKTAEKIKNESWFKTEGYVGAAQRKLSTALGDTTYYELSKNLAGTALKAAESSGTTNARQDLIQASQGDITYPPEVLIKVARRTYGDLLGTEMQAKGAALWQQKATSANMDLFKRKWSENADSKAFEIMHLQKEREGLDPKSQEYKKLSFQADEIAGPNKQKQQELIKKINNLKKLSQTGEL